MSPKESIRSVRKMPMYPLVPLLPIALVATLLGITLSNHRRLKRLEKRLTR